jgi:hypothetical protein
MKTIEEVSLSTAIKILTVWSEEDFLYSVNFPEHLHEISSGKEKIKAVKGNDYFLVIEDDIPSPYLHGRFRNWDFVTELRVPHGKTLFMHSKFQPPVNERLTVDPFLLYELKLPARGNEPRPFGELSLEEAADFIKENDPPIYHKLFHSLVRDSVEEKLFTVLRDETGKITFLHLVRKTGDSHDGVYLSSSLSFGETTKEFLRSLERLGISSLSTVVLQSNEKSRRFHEFLGFKSVRLHSFLIRFLNHE